MTKPKPNKKEEITDLIDPSAYDNESLRDTFKVGAVMAFTQATIKITKIDRKNKRTWGEHIVLVNQRIVGTHHEHDVDTSKVAYDFHGAPWCRDCKVPVTEPSTEDGDKKALDRKDRDEKDLISAQ